eukprot:gnl/MRDRNA2_/MRDRNA2_89820_c0_seq1.p1 gnl/MRDRNA2_/MRDRNA2_89820_c0~~gnl/MRDRNA2_/MRDRNA2_89820_c0_seq1.p1  ORF type:complete len:165 (+),score=29.75 gnl/MRDRNA2_/MRDRNA2_89820_c0_seq1:95-589(+)
MSLLRMNQIHVTLGLLATASAYTNVNGGALQKCSGPGMALTGFTRNGQCIDQNDDAGSHHICIDMASNVGGNFCQVTGQPNWCGSMMQCDDSEGMCPVKDWCVCQWAFAAYIQRAGGCDKIQKVVCESTNMVALKAYREEAPQDSGIMAALKCLESKCGIASEF